MNGVRKRTTAGGEEGLRVVTVEKRNLPFVVDESLRIGASKEPAAIRLKIGALAFLENLWRVERASEVLQQGLHRLQLVLSGHGADLVSQARCLWHAWRLASMSGTIEVVPAGGFSRTILGHFEVPAGRDNRQVASMLWRAVREWVAGEGRRERAIELLTGLGIPPPRGDDVTVVSLQRPGSWLSMEVLGRQGRKLYYRIASSGVPGSAGHHALQALMESDSLEFSSPLQLVCRRGKKVTARIGPEIFFFGPSPEGLSLEVWDYLARRAIAEPPETREAGADTALRGESSQPEPSQRVQRLADELRQLMEARELSVFSPTVSPSLSGYVLVELSNPARRDEKLQVLVEHAEDARRYFKKIGPLAISYSDSTPLDGPFRRRLFRKVLSLLVEVQR